MTTTTTAATWAPLQASHPRMVASIEAMKCLQALDDDIFWPIIDTDKFGIDRKVAAIEVAAGIKNKELREACPRRRSGVGISADASVRYLAGLKRRLRGVDFSPSYWLDKVHHQVEEYNGRNTTLGSAGRHWLTERSRSSEAWMFAAAETLLREVG